MENSELDLQQKERNFILIWIIMKRLENIVGT